MKNKVFSKIITLVLAFTMCIVNMPLDIFASEDLLVTDKTVYTYGENVMVTANYLDGPAYVGVYAKDDVVTVDEHNLLPYYWYNINSTEEVIWQSGVSYNVFETKTTDRTDNLFLAVGEYKVLLVDASYEVLDSCEITIVEEVISEDVFDGEMIEDPTFEEEEIAVDKVSMDDQLVLEEVVEVRNELAVTTNSEVALLSKSNTVSIAVNSSEVKIRIEKVGTSGSAQVVRFHAEEYPSADKMVGISKHQGASGVVVGDYALGTSTELKLSRYEKDGTDNLYSKYYIMQGNKIVAGPYYATEIESVRDKKPFNVATKKGMGAGVAASYDAAINMGVGYTDINIDVGALILANEDENGNPIDNTNRGDVIEFESNGEIFYFNANTVYTQDAMISFYTRNGINVTAILIAWAKRCPDDYPSALLYLKPSEQRWTMGFNTSTERGRKYWVAAMEFMANRYSQASTYGVINKFIVGNEIDYTYDWYLLQPNTDKNGKVQRVEFNTFMEEFARTFRLANNAVKKYNASAKVLISLTHNWAQSTYDAYNVTGNHLEYNSYAPKEMLDWFSKYETARGDYDWGIVVHPYPIGTSSSKPTLTDPAFTGKNGQADPITGDWRTSPWITAANLELYQLYFEQPENKYNGTEMRTVSVTEVSICNLDPNLYSEEEYMTSLYEQAASIAQYYYRAALIDCIDEITYFQLHNQETLKLGLVDDDGNKKPSYDVWTYVDSNKSFNYSNKYLKYLKEDSWLDVMKTVKSEFDWDKAWDLDKILVRTVESNEVERTLKVNKNEFTKDEAIVVTATGDFGDIVGLYKANDNIDKVEPIYSYPVHGTSNLVSYKSGTAYNIITFGEISASRKYDSTLPAGNYKVVLNSSETGERVVENIKITEDYTYGSEAKPSFTTDKTVYKTGEPVIVTATGSGDDWIGLYAKDDKVGNVSCIYWYYVNDASRSQFSGKPTILQRTVHGEDSSNPKRRLAAGEYVLYLFDPANGNEYRILDKVDITIEGIVPEGLTGIKYTLDNETDGFASGTVTVTMSNTNTTAESFVMYWADENEKPLEGYTALSPFKLYGPETTYRMVSHTIIPVGAKKLIAYTTNGDEMSTNYVSCDLPENCHYIETGTPLTEFQIISDIHITATDKPNIEAVRSNEHIVDMLEDTLMTSPNSQGIFVNGDIANTGLVAEYDTLFNLYYKFIRENKVKEFPEFHLAMGNHDWYTNNPDRQFQKQVVKFNTSLKEMPENVYYHEEVNGYHYIYLSGEKAANNAFLSAKQLNWFDSLMAEISAEDPNKPVFVFLHQSFYNTVAGSLPGETWNGVDSEAVLRRILKKYGQIFIFSGHSHWRFDSINNMYSGDSEFPVAFNTSSVSYLWHSYDVPTGEFERGSQGYTVTVYDDKIVYQGRDYENHLNVAAASYVVYRNEITTAKEVYDITLDQQNVNLDAKANTELLYSSSDTSICSVTESGTLLPKKTGTVTITISAGATNTAVVNRKYVTVNISEANVYRVFGNTRYETSTEIADAVVELNGTKVDSIIVANGTNFADALAGSYLAAKKNAPILMTDGKNGATIRNYIRNNVNANGTVYILGGTAAVNDKVLSGLTGYTVKRLAGADRYATNLEILKEAGVTNEEIIVATGTGFADSLSASASGKPILLVGKKLSKEQKAYLASVQTQQYYVIGGTSAVSVALENEVKTYGEVKRIGGSTRYQTSVMVAEQFFNNATQAVVAYGRNFPDGLCGGPLAYAMEAPLILTENSKAADAVAFTTTIKIASGVVLGGAGLVSDNTTRKIFGLNSGSAIVKK